MSAQFRTGEGISISYAECVSQEFPPHQRYRHFREAFLECRAHQVLRGLRDIRAPRPRTERFVQFRCHKGEPAQHVHATFRTHPADQPQARVALGDPVQQGRLFRYDRCHPGTPGPERSLRGNFQIVAAVFDLLFGQINPLQVEIGIHFAQSSMDRQ